METQKINSYSKKNLMTEGSVFKSIILFSIPLILGNFLQQMYNAVDSIIVGNYIGSDGLAAVGSSTPLISLLISFSIGISTGAGIIIAQFLGAKDKDKVQISVHTALGISVVLGLILSVVGVIYTPKILTLMKTPQNVMSESVIYMKIYSFGLVFSIIYNMGAGILNAAGNSKQPLYYLAIASFLNIFLDLFFIEFMKMGVAGAAIATNICQFISCVLIFRFLIKSKEDYKVFLKRIEIQKDMAIKIIKIGLPTGIQNTVISFSNVLVQSSVNSFGSLAMAGFGAYLKIDGFNILPILSLSIAITTFTGQNYGAKKIERIKKGVLITLLLGIVYTIILGITLLYFSKFFMKIFTSNEEVIEYGILAMKYFCPFYFLLSILQVLSGAIRGVGKTVPPMIILLISLCLFRVIWIQIAIPMFKTIESVYILYPISWGIGAFIIILYTWKGSWKNKLRE